MFQILSPTPLDRPRRETEHPEPESTEVCTAPKGKSPKPQIAQTLSPTPPSSNSLKGDGDRDRRDRGGDDRGLTQA